MSVRKLKDGNSKPWLCEVYIHGAGGKRVRKRFATKGEAVAFERYTLKEVDTKPWLGEKPELRTLHDLAALWFRLHGQHLTSGENSFRRLCFAIEEMGNPVAKNFTAKDYLHWRSERVNRYAAQHGKDKQAAAATHNVDLALMKGVFNFLIGADEWHFPNPLASVKKLASDQAEMTYLTEDEIRQLLGSFEKATYKASYLLVCKLCMATGARISEIENLTRSQVSQFKLTFTKTKTKQNRTVPISEDLYLELIRYDEEYGLPVQPVRKMLEKRLAKLFPRLPDGQKTHVFRHTFASHFMQHGGDILTLQRILGHANIQMTMKYAHFSPDHLQQAVSLNPIARLNNI
ncbi:phage integrase [Grimontia sp. NTOU-MAR1]|uniref:phage integrase n=1 Tax=Grimontia sp. NTOU-MAR1 TaxID=3111011 RepID=UPI002DBB9ED8|nr:tyrosine-type recombinase/integrase [Grimontia sp. NTOU-MAR1]WRV96494.1 tyrosine-type recombinase/integrase [Grimontia sp. NTOU-MAR1]